MSKRGQNEGSIYKIHDGTYRAQLNLGYQGGKRKRKFFRGKTRGEVRDKLTEALRNQQLGLPTSNDKMTVDDFLSRWLEDSARQKVRPSTFARYSREVRLHIIPEIGKIKLSKLTPVDVQALLNSQSKAGLSPRSVRHIYAVLRVALNKALQWGLVARNVAALADPPRVSRYIVEPLNPEQARSFLEAVKGDRLEALYSAAVALGLRRGEALALKWEDIDLEAGTLIVRHTLQRIDGELKLVEPKSERSRRSIALPKTIVRALKEHRNRQRKEKMAQGPDWQETGFVFTTLVGTPLDGDNVYKMFQRLLKQHNLPKFRFHDLRHTAASLLLVQGVSPRVVMETLGHSQISLTMDTYSHVMPVLQRDAAEKMDQILSNMQSASYPEATR